MKCLLIFLAFGLCVDRVISLRILGLFPYQGKSHFFVFKVYLEELAKRGHDVTVVSHFPDARSGYEDISLADTSKVLEDDVPMDRSYTTVAGIGLLLTSIGADNCEKMLAIEAVQELWKTQRKFDVVVTEQFNSDCSLGVAHALRAPVVTLTSHVLLPWHYARLGIPDNVAFVPFHFFGGGTNPTMYQRIEAIIFRAYFNTLYKFVTQRSNQKSLEKYFGKIPELDELAGDVKFILLYHGFPLTGSRLFPSNVVEVGGYHVAAPNPLNGEHE